MFRQAECTESQKAYKEANTPPTLIQPIGNVLQHSTACQTGMFVMDRHLSAGTWTAVHESSRLHSHRVEEEPKCEDWESHEG